MSGTPILIVDDNPVNMKLARVLLTQEGFAVREARDAEEAQEVLKSFRPRLILMDVQLPGLNGLDLTRQLKASPDTRDIIIVALTAYAMKGDEEKARDAGCDGYLTKPINTRTLAASLQSFLAGQS